MTPPKDQVWAFALQGKPVTAPRSAGFVILDGKQVILLSYPDEPHHLSRKENQKDFQRRMKEYFDHYLKGKPAPEWMVRGVDYLEKERSGGAKE